jgi:hypothetical protein
LLSIMLHMSTRYILHLVFFSLLLELLTPELQANPHEKDHEVVFWGSNVQLLRTIKMK